MSDLAFFPKTHTRHAEDQRDAKSPDPEELQRLLGQLVEALSPLSGRRGDQGIRIRNFRSDRYDLVDDLIVVIEDRDGEYIANSFDTDQYGHGYSPDAAIHHLCSVLEDYYELLLEDEGHLSQRLNAHLRYLRSILRERE